MTTLAVISEDQMVTLARVYRALGEPGRLRIIALISDSEMRVNDITEAMNLAQPTVSHHLKVLREAGLVSSRKKSTWVYYRATPGARRFLDQPISLDE